MEKEEEKNKNKESSSSGSNRRKISQSLWCVFCFTLAAEIEKARLEGDTERLALLQFVLSEHQRVSHELN